MIHETPTEEFQRLEAEIRVLRARCGSLKEAGEALEEAAREAQYRLRMRSAELANADLKPPADTLREALTRWRDAVQEDV